MAPHFRVVVRVHRSVSDCAAKSSNSARLSNFASRVDVLPRQAVIEHVNLATFGRNAHREIRRFDVAMKKTDFVNVADRLKNVPPEAQSRRQRKCAFWLRSSEFGERLADQAHDDVIESFVPAASIKLANVV